MWGQGAFPVEAGASRLVTCQVCGSPIARAPRYFSAMLCIRGTSQMGPPGLWSPEGQCPQIPGMWLGDLPETQVLACPLDRVQTSFQCLCPMLGQSSHLRLALFVGFPPQPLPTAGALSPVWGQSARALSLAPLFLSLRGLHGKFLCHPPRPTPPWAQGLLTASLLAS